MPERPIEEVAAEVAEKLGWEHLGEQLSSAKHVYKTADDRSLVTFTTPEHRERFAFRVMEAANQQGVTITVVATYGDDPVEVIIEPMTPYAAEDWSMSRWSFRCSIHEAVIRAAGKAL